MSKARYALAILGDGPVGIVAAMAAAQAGAALLLSRGARGTDGVPRIESVPASVLALLIDFGVHPKHLEVQELAERRRIAWQDAEPVASIGPVTAHLDHRRLQVELLHQAHRTPRLHIVSDAPPPVRTRNGWQGQGWHARHVLDCTGRAAALASCKVTAPRPWVARPFWHLGKQASREFCIAALPFGYAYRLGDAHRDCLWVAGRGPPLSASPAALELTLKGAGAAWLLEGLPPLASMHTARGFPVSIQWAVHECALAAGDAALARDVLSSQGLAAGLSSALLAASCQSAEDRANLKFRLEQERVTHLRHLLRQLEACRFVGASTWQAYRDFIHRAAGLPPAAFAA
jgi:hypothetical protein